MKHFLLSALFVLLSIISVHSQTTKKVLFIGNSYTSVNNLPLLVEEMANNTDDILIRDANTPGGYRFMDHASNTNTLDKINTERLGLCGFAGSKSGNFFERDANGKRGISLRSFFKRRD